MTNEKEKKLTLTHRGMCQILNEGEFEEVGNFTINKDKQGRKKLICNITNLDKLVKNGGTFSGFINEYDPEIEAKVRAERKKLYEEGSK